jgi:polysaccharide export outer membrane protein
MKKIFLLILFIYISSLSFAQIRDESEAKQHYRVGRIYYEHGLYKEAEREFNRALKILKREGDIARAAGTKVPEERMKESPPRRAKTTTDYLIGEGDSLSISVWENPDLDQEVVVRPDGKISFPLIDEVAAAGYTVSELDDTITKRLKEYIRFPDVSISLKQMAAGKVIVLGQVDFPGVYSIVGKTSILEVIALAGGLTPDSVASSVIVVKDGLSENPVAQRLSINKAIHNPASKQNILLHSGDIVFVPKKFIADVNYFLTTIFDPLVESSLSTKQFKRW